MQASGNHLLLEVGTEEPGGRAAVVINSLFYEFQPRHAQVCELVHIVRKGVVEKLGYYALGPHSTCR